MKNAIGICAVSLLALGACSKKTETASTGTAAPATATAPAPMTPPSRKAGLWEQTIATDKMKQTMQMCLDETTDQKMKWWGSQGPRGQAKSDCTEQKITPRVGGGWDFHAVCAMGESGTVTSDGSATGDFSSHYTVDVTSTTAGSPMPQANGVRKVSIEAVWKGPCPADMKAGDMELPGGMKINAAGAMAGGGAAAGGVDVAKLKAEAMSGHMNAADIAKMREQAKAMAAAAHQQQ